jgi:oligoribonuclease (3'-5' exoribonuclease)
VATTGLDPGKDALLEVYLRVTDMRAEETEGVYYGVLGHLVNIEDRCDANVQRWHTQSGLFDDMKKAKLAPFEMGNEIMACLRELKGCEVYVAGYAPAFCRQFIRERTNHDSDDFLHFQNIDVTSLEKFFAVAQHGEIYKRPYSARVKAKVDAAVEQYRFYLKMMGTLMGDFKA